MSTSSSGSRAASDAGSGGPRRRGLRVGQVVAVLALDEQVLADVGPRHELVVHAAADLSGLGLDDDVVQPAPVEDPLGRPGT